MNKLKIVVDTLSKSCKMDHKKERNCSLPSKRKTIMNFIIALPAGVAITAFVMSLIHFGSIATVVGM